MSITPNKIIIMYNVLLSTTIFLFIIEIVKSAFLIFDFSSYFSTQIYNYTLFLAFYSDTVPEPIRLFTLIAIYSVSFVSFSISSII